MSKRTLFFFLPIFLNTGSFHRFEKGPESLKNTGHYTYQEQRFYHKNYNLNDLPYAYTNYTFTHLSMLVNTAPVYRRGQITDLEYQQNHNIANIVMRTPRYGTLSLGDFISQSSNQGFLVIHKGKIIFERYDKMADYQYHGWLSMSKTLVGWAAEFLESKGVLDLSKTVADYLPEYKKSAYGRVTLRNLLDMSSGIFANDDFFNRLAPYIRFRNTLFAPSFQSQMKILPSTGTQGKEYVYSTVNSMLLTMVIEAVTDRPFNDFLSHNLWFKIGAEHDALLGVFGISMGQGVPVGGGTGLMMSTLRDLGRYGLIYTPSAKDLFKEDLVSDEFLQYIKDPAGKPNNEKYLMLRTNPQDFDPGDVGFGKDDIPLYGASQWDMIFADGDMFKFGFNSQGLYVSPGKDLVIAYFGYDDRPPEYPHAYARAIARYFVDGNLNQHEWKMQETVASHTPLT
ncbi:MAG: serine hydrolase domain-containing protein [Spirochaetia bacterium]